MIRTDDELMVVRKQLLRVEEALASLRREVLPQNRRNYEVLSEGYVEQVLALRAEIDHYLGVFAADSVPENAAVSIALEGETVRLGSTPAAVITRVIDTFRKGLQALVDRTGAVERPPEVRRREGRTERLCDLSLVGIRPVGVRIDLGESAAGPPFSDDEKRLLHRAIDLLFDGLEWAGEIEGPRSGEGGFENHDVPTRQAVLSVVSRLIPPRGGPVEAVSFFRKSAFQDRPVRQARLGRQSRDRVRKEFVRLANGRGYSEVAGVIRSIDLDNQTFILRDPADQQPPLVCEYDEVLTDVIKTALDCVVVVTGLIETSRKTRKEKLEVETIEVLTADDEPSPMPEGPEMGHDPVPA